MTPENFCFYLKGLMELVKTDSFNEKQVELIKEKLNSVFEKQTINGFDLITDVLKK